MHKKSGARQQLEASEAKERTHVAGRETQHGVRVRLARQFAEEDRREKKLASQLETSPERIATIREVFDVLMDVGGPTSLDAFIDPERLRAVATRLRLPYLAVQMSRFGNGTLGPEDIDEYNAWRALVAKGGAQ